MVVRLVAIDAIGNGTTPPRVRLRPRLLPRELRLLHHEVQRDLRAAPAARLSRDAAVAKHVRDRRLAGRNLAAELAALHLADPVAEQEIRPPALAHGHRADHGAGAPAHREPLVRGAAPA